MSETLLIFYQADRCNWCLLNDKKQIVSDIENATLQEISNKHPAKKAIVVLSGIQCHYFYPALPKGNKRKALATIPYLLEEQLSEDIDALLFVTAKKTDDHIGVVVINKVLLDSIKQQFADASIPLQAIYPAFALLPERHICLYRDLAICHIDKQNQFSCKQNLLSLLLQSTDTDTNSLNCITDSQSNETLSFPCQQKTQKHPLAFFASQLGNARFNLLKKKRAPLNIAAQLKIWALPAILSLSLLGLYLYQNLLQTQQLKQQAQQTRQLSIEILKRTFPEIRKTRNPRMLMKSKLKQILGKKQQKQHNLSKMLYQVGSTLKDFSNLTILSIDGNKQTLEVEIQVKQLAQIDEIKSILAVRDGFKVRVSAISQNRSGAKGRLIIQ